MAVAAGRFITLEGGEGAGKSTQARRLVEALRARGLPAMATREVGGAPGAEAIRELWLGKGESFWEPLTEVLLVMAARREHLVRTIWPALAGGFWVVSDRFVDSTRVYQGIGLGLGADKIDSLYRAIAGDFWPDRTILLDLPVEAGLARMAARQGEDDRYQQKHRAFHQKLRQGWLELAASERARFRVVDAAQSADQVAEAILGAALEGVSLPALPDART